MNQCIVKSLIHKKIIHFKFLSTDTNKFIIYPEKPCILLCLTSNGK